MKNHEIVPEHLVSVVAGVKIGTCRKILMELTKHGLISHEHKKGKSELQRPILRFDP